MYAQKEKPKGNESRTVAKGVFQKHKGGESILQFVDNRQNVFQQSIQAKADHFFGENAIRIKQMKQVKPSGLESGDTAANVWIKRDTTASGKEYTKNIDAPSDDSLKAMVKISQSIPGIVNQTDVPAMMSDKWVDESTDLNKSGKDEVDPFRVKFNHSYTPTELSTDTTPMIASVHFGRYKPGYIIEQTDGADIGRMTGAGGSGSPTSYAEDHDYSDSGSTVDTLGNDKGMGSKLTGLAWDNRSKIMGEGWRFAPVLDLASQKKLKDESRFYTKANKLEDKNQIQSTGDVILYALFKKLAQGWFKVYGGGAAISNTLMKSSMVTEAKTLSHAQMTGTGNKTVKEVAVVTDFASTANDYDLDT
ncbi:MAG: hypothetical protein GQ564_22610 [Bacteroidales bacterium]|nr:hypothetical protein [Bacteroidales bacterium]